MIHVKRGNVKQGKLASIGRAIVLVIGIYLLIVFSRGILEIKQAYLRLSEAREQLAVEELKNRQLKQKQADISGPGYIESIARNNLNMQREGETVVVIPRTQELKESKTQIQDEAVLPNWKKWWGLIK